MQQHRKAAAARLFEPLENRQLLSGTLNTSQSLMVFNAVKSSSASPTETLTISNTGTSSLSLNGLSVVNDPSSSTASAARFAILNAGSMPSSLAPGQSFVVQVDYSATAVGLDSAYLDISSSDPNTPVAAVSLHGIGTAGLGGSNQPSLARILQAYDIPTNVGESVTATVYPEPPGAGSQEVSMQQMVKAGSGPVTIDVLASFTNAEAEPYILGYYTPGNPAAKTELFYTPTSEYQSVYVQPNGITSFDPGSGTFGMYFYSSAYKYYGYSEDSLNTWDTTDDRKFRFFPMENPDGTVVPNTYVMTSTEYDAPAGYDFTNIVAIISNVEPAPNANSGPVINVTHSNTIPGSDTLMFNTIEHQNATVGDTFHNINTVTISNTGTSPLVINSISLSDTTDWQLVSPPTFPITLADGASTTITVKFIATTVPSGLPYNETDGTKNPNGGGLYSANLIINSNDPATPSKVLPLEGYFQTYSEDIEEPSLQTIVNLMAGYTTQIATTTPTPDLLQSVASNGTPTYYGDEVVSAYWTEADSSQPVSVIQLAAFHTQGSSGGFYYYPQGSPSKGVQLLYDNGDSGQSLFPLAYGSSSSATGSFSSTGTFGFLVSGPAGPTEYSDDSLNSDADGVGGGHGMRFFPVYDAAGNLVPNTYLCAVDYFDGSATNFDTQDQVFIISNIRPVTKGKSATAPQSQGAAPAVASAVGVANSDGSVSLEWTPIFGDSSLSGYNVYRSTSATGGFTKLTASPITATSFLDTTAPAGTVVYYEITAIDSVGESLGTIARVTTTGGGPLISANVGETPSATVTTVTAGSAYNVTAGGPGVTATSDGFQYLFTNQTGNFDVAVQITGITVAGNYATAGIMARSGLDVASPDVYVAASPVNFRFKYRTTESGNTAIYQAGTPSYPNGSWVRLVRVGNVFTGYYSLDGVHWTEIASVTMALPNTVQLGLAVASNVSTMTTTAQLRNYGPTSNSVPAAPPTPTNLTAAGTTSGVTLSWSPVSYANLAGYDVYSSTSASGPWTLLTNSPISGTTYTDSTAIPGVTTYYQVTAVDSLTGAQSTAATTSGAAIAPSSPGTGLTSIDIGASSPGSTTVSSDGYTYTVVAGGPGVTDTSDGLRYLYSTQTGNFDVAVQITGITVAGNYSTAGILVRSTLDADSPDVYIAATPSAYKFKYRPTVGANTTIVQSGTCSYPSGTWVRLTRVGNVFTGYTSTDGIHWTMMSSVTLALPNTLDLGLGVASNSTSMTTTATLSHYGPTTVVAPPTGLTATSESSGIGLSWTASGDSNLLGYNVYSSSSASGTYTLLTSSPITATSFTDTSSLAASGATVYYRVTAVDSITGIESTAATASGAALSSNPTPPPTSAPTLTSLDIGASIAGSTTQSSDGFSYTVVAGGPGITGTSDGLRYLYATQTGNFDVAVQITGITVAGNYSTAGILVRSGLDAGSPDVYVAATPSVYKFKYRTSEGATTNLTQSGTCSYPNGTWVRLTRVGNVFAAYYSSDGVHWTLMSSVTIALPTTLYLGLGVASNDPTMTTTATMSHYGPTTVVAPPTGATASGVSGGVSLSWTASSDSNLLGYNVYSSSSANGTYTLLTSSPITTTSYIDTSSLAASGATVYYRVTAIDAVTGIESTAATANGAATPTAPSGPTLTSLDINSSIAGSTTTISNGYTVTAGGPGVEDTADGFRYLYTQVTGNFDVEVEVNSITVAGTYSTAGIMARATLDDDSADVYAAASPVNYRFKYRSSTGATTAIAQEASTNYSAGVWVRLSRVGNVFTAYESTDGVNWTQMNQVTLALPQTIYLGLAVASNDTTDTTTAVLSNYGNTGS